MKKNVITRLENDLYFKSIENNKKEVSFLEFLVAHTSKSHLYGRQTLSQDSDDLMVFLSSIRGNFISDYISLLGSTDITFLRNMKKFAKVKHESVSAMIRSEQDTMWQYHKKLEVNRADLVSSQFRHLTSF